MKKRIRIVVRWCRVEYCERRAELNGFCHVHFLSLSPKARNILTRTHHALSAAKSEYQSAIDYALEESKSWNPPAYPGGPPEA